VSDQPLTTEGSGNESALPRGTETILLVEDEPSVRALAQRTLEGRGYKVLSAGGYADAMAFAALARVDLLLTDVVMPDVGGRELADLLLAQQPRTRVVFMSGYPDDALRPFGLGEDITFLRKPFTTAELTRIVRSSLDARDAEPSVVAV
jgi:CheY-like chemotaxis protein